jgi:hypothetical protein
VRRRRWRRAVEEKAPQRCWAHADDPRSSGASTPGSNPRSSASSLSSRLSTHRTAGDIGARRSVVPAQQELPVAAVGRRLSTFGRWSGRPLAGRGRPCGPPLRRFRRALSSLALRLPEPSGVVLFGPAQLQRWTGRSAERGMGLRHWRAGSASPIDRRSGRRQAASPAHAPRTAAPVERRAADDRAFFPIEVALATAAARDGGDDSGERRCFLKRGMVGRHEIGPCSPAEEAGASPGMLASRGG